MKSAQISHPHSPLPNNNCDGKEVDSYLILEGIAQEPQYEEGSYYSFEAPEQEQLQAVP